MQDSGSTVELLRSKIHQTSRSWLHVSIDIISVHDATCGLAIGTLARLCCIRLPYYWTSGFTIKTELYNLNDNQKVTRIMTRRKKETTIP